MTIELFDNIAESNINPSGPTDGWGSLEENSGRYWLNTTTNVQFFHNGVVWLNYDSASGMSVTRSGITLKTAGQTDLLLSNIGGALNTNGAPIGGGIQTGTEAQMLALSSPAVGTQFLTCPTDPADCKLCIYNGETWQVTGETFQTKSSQALVIGNIVETDLASPDRVKKATSLKDKDILGVVVFVAASGADQNVTIAYSGRWPVFCQSATYIQTLYIQVSNTNGVGQGTNSLLSGSFARPLEITTIPVSGGLVKCILFSVKR